jgi:CRISPR-associated protein Cas1
MKRAVYVPRPGAVLRRAGQRMRVMDKRQVVDEVPLADVGQLVLVGASTVTPPLMSALLDQGSDIVLLTARGRYRGRIDGGRMGRQVTLRMRQYAKALDPGSALQTAKRIVDGKLANQRALLLRHARRHGVDERLRQAQRALAAARMRAAKAEMMDELRGCEGSGAAAYFRGFPALLRQPGVRFDGRNRRPPLDPVNALLSLGYTLLYAAVEAAVHTVGLDPWLGTLHAATANRPSLVCDLVEEHRAGLVDALVVGAFNRKAITLDGFERAGIGEPVIVKSATVRRFIVFFEERLRRPADYPPLGVRLAWRRILEQQCRAYARHLLEPDTPYSPYILR